MTYDLWQLDLEEVNQTSKRRFDLHVITTKILNDPRLSNEIFGNPILFFKICFLCCVYVF
jgi:hypothetical protein